MTLRDESGVSPVIGVIIMLAIVVILAAVSAAFVFGMASPTHGHTDSLYKKTITIQKTWDRTGESVFIQTTENETYRVTHLGWVSYEHYPHAGCTYNVTINDNCEIVAYSPIEVADVKPCASCCSGCGACCP